MGGGAQLDGWIEEIVAASGSNVTSHFIYQRLLTDSKSCMMGTTKEVPPEPAIKVKRGRGRPRGVKNKKK